MSREIKNSSRSRELLEELEISIIGGIIAGCLMNLYMEIVSLFIH